VQILTLDGEEVARDPFTAEIDMSDIDKGTYPHYMLKEIDEQPAVMRKIIQAYQDENDQLTIDSNILDALEKADRLYI
ncbi:glutamine--fructose-6-phosphate aminotransferase, partial [Bacillus sp. SIMBA_161]